MFVLFCFFLGWWSFERLYDFLLLLFLKLSVLPVQIWIPIQRFCGLTLRANGAIRVPNLNTRGLADPSPAFFACHRQRSSGQTREACLRSGRVCFLSVTKPRLLESVKVLRGSLIHHLHFTVIAISWVRSGPMHDTGQHDEHPSAVFNTGHCLTC